MSNGSPLTDETLAAEAAAGPYHGKPAGVNGPPHKYSKENRQEKSIPYFPKPQLVQDLTISSHSSDSHPSSVTSILSQQNQLLKQLKSPSRAPMKGFHSVPLKKFKPIPKPIQKQPRTHFQSPNLFKNLTQNKSIRKPFLNIGSFSALTSQVRNDPAVKVASRPSAKLITRLPLKHQTRPSPKLKTQPSFNIQPKTSKIFNTFTSIPQTLGPLHIPSKGSWSVPQCEYPIGGGSYTCISFGSPQAPIFSYHTIWGTHGVILGAGSGFPGAVPATHEIGSGSSPFKVTFSRPKRKVNKSNHEAERSETSDLIWSGSKNVEMTTLYTNTPKQQYGDTELSRLENDFSNLENDLSDIENEFNHLRTVSSYNQKNPASFDNDNLNPHSERDNKNGKITEELQRIPNILMPSMSTIFVTPLPKF